MLYEYVHFIYSIFSDKGFLFQYNFNTIFFGTILFVALVLRLFLAKPSSDFIYVLNIFVGMSFCVPSIIMYQIGGINFLVPLLSVVFVFLLTNEYLSMPSIKAVNIKFSDQKYILFGLTVLMIIPFFLTFGFKFNTNIFSFGSELYQARMEARAQSNIFTGYLFGPLTKVLLPSLMVYGLLRKNKLLWISGIALMMYIFMINPHKSVFMSIFVVLAFYFFKNYNAKAGMLISGIVGLIVGSIIFSWTTGNLLPESIFVRRMFFLPVQISNEYFLFFNDNHIYLSHSILKSFNDYPYDLEPAFLMGKHIYNNPLTSCNTGIVADGYMNFGIIGSIVFMTIAAVIIRFLEALNMHHSFFGISFLFVLLFLNSALFTSLLTHGGLFFLLLGIFFYKNTHNLE